MAAAGSYVHIEYATAAELVDRLKAGPADPAARDFVVVDVRDDEREYDGHIAGSLHFASAEFDDTLPRLWPAIRGKKAVIMHCALSQVRGPSCARKLHRQLEALASQDKSQRDAAPELPTIFVLERGFNGWAAGGKPVCRCGDMVCKQSVQWPW
ncbi:Rhodanese or Cell cycle control phosphatase [Klebsormidium nitens]|uniref:arsenate reductase (glutathione/glutaredoxin) n=1 Tax=Klebsormidium nitens TaxID=105231 RepID=A0A1Y1IHS2_KLENI|nr:Rhodanese or Cell cycle control phosphatase [Klebsormidium nitens]|eukprot:GAQ88621.1 Rhodanese or Cell cycle control phosphatase [Klebsormidium nitens]